MWIAPAHIVDGDNAEFSTLGALGGVAHPSGYPLYVLWLRAMSWLPGASPAHTAAIATAILGAASIVMLHAAARAWGARPLAATISVAIFAGAPVVLAMYTEAEVFALNGLVVATVLWLAARAGPLRGGWRAAALGLVAGLGMANNLTCVLVAPIGILGVVRGVREAGVRAVGLAGLGLGLGLLPYGYLLIAPEHAGSWGKVDGIADVWTIFLRREYGGPGTFATDRETVPAMTSLAALAVTVGRSWLWLPVVAGLAALGARIVRPGDRWGWAMLLVSLGLAGPLLATRFNIAPTGVGRYVVARFHILPALLLAIPIADALDRIGGLVARRLPALGASVGGGLAILGFAAVAGTALPHILHVHAPAVEQQVRNTLRSLPPGAIVFGVDDDLATGTNYVQLVLGERRDVVYVHMPLKGLPWYRARLVARGIALDDHMLDDAHARGLAVFVQPYERDVLAQYPHYPFGILVRVLPRGATLPSLDDIVAMNKAITTNLELGYEPPGLDDEWPTAVHMRYARTWLRIAKLLAEAGRTDDAAWAIEMARAIGPRP